MGIFGLLKEHRSSIVILPIIVFLLLLPPFFLKEYWTHVLLVSFYFIAVVASWNLLFGYSGQFSFAQSAMAAFGSYSSAFFVLGFSLPIPVGILLGGAGAAAMSYLLGRLVLKMKTIYLAFTTFAFAEAFRLFIMMNWQWTRGGLGLSVPYFFGTPFSFPYYYLFLVACLASLLILYKIVSSRIGLYLKAIREDEEAAAAMGVDTIKWKNFAFTVSGFIAGALGACLSYYVGIIDPTLAALPAQSTIMVMAILGGTGSFFGPILGAPVIEILQEYLRIAPELRMVIFGLSFIIMMTLFKGGLFGVVQRLLRHTKSERVSRLLKL